MTIYVYSGTVGSGKSLHAASDIRYCLNRRYPIPVVANFELSEGAPVRRPDLYTYVPNADLTADYLQDFACDWWECHDFREDRILLVLDEVQLLFNARNWSDRNRMSFLQFMSQSRKYGYQVVLIAQNLQMIDNQFRMLCEFDINHRRVSSWPGIGWVLGALTGGRCFARVTYLIQNGHSKERLGMRFWIPRKRDMRMYDSYKRFEGQRPTYNAK